MEHKLRNNNRVNLRFLLLLFIVSTKKIQNETTCENRKNRNNRQNMDRKEYALHSSNNPTR